MKHINILLVVLLLFASGSIYGNDRDFFPEKVKAHLEGELPKQKDKEEKRLTSFEKKLKFKLSQ